MNILTFYLYRSCTVSCAWYSDVHEVNRSKIKRHSDAQCGNTDRCGRRSLHVRSLTPSVKLDLCVVASSYRTYSCVNVIFVVFAK
jgi:hypothetical protein